MADEYDWYAAEGRREDLRPLQEAMDRLFEDPEVERRGITVFGGCVDQEDGSVELEVGTRDAEAAHRWLEERLGARVKLEVTAEAGVVEEVIELQRWAVSADGRRLDLGYEGNRVEGEPSVEIEESAAAVLVTLRAPVWQGVTTLLMNPETVSTELATPLGDRPVIDGWVGTAPEARRPRT